MIIELILVAFAGFLKAAFFFINIPSLPDELVESIQYYLSLVYDNLSFFGFFVRPTTLLLAFDLVVAIWLFYRLYKITMWIIKKIPVSTE